MVRIGQRGIVLGAALALVAAQLVGLALLLPDSPLALARGSRGDPAEPWPPFLMTYRDTRRGIGTTSAYETRVFRVSYTSRSVFEVTLLEHSRRPDAVGLTMAVTGSRIVTRDPRVGASEQTVGSTARAPTPADWLVPGALPALLAEPGVALSPLGDGLVLLRREQERDQLVEEITFRADAGIPLRLVQSRGGLEVRRIEVLSLQVTPQP